MKTPDGTSTRPRLALASLLILATATLGYAHSDPDGRDRDGRDPDGRDRDASRQIAPPVTHSGVRLQAALDREAVLAGGDGQVGVELVISGDAVAREMPARVPTDLVIVLDTSGSMQGEKLASAKRAVAEATERLGNEDRFALIGYANEARSLIALAPVDAAARASWRGHLAEVQASGGTNMAAGLDLALAALSRGAERSGRTARILLISDGHANVGDASPGGLSARARRASVAELTLSTIGVGLDYNEQLMTQIADAGTGNYYFLERGTELASLFDRELRAARATVATGLAVEISPGRDVDVVDAAGYPLERRADRVVFRPGALFAGQERRIWITFALAGRASERVALGDIALDFTQDGRRERLSLGGLPRVAVVDDGAQYAASFDAEAWGRRVATEEYGLLQSRIAEDVRSGDRAGALEKLEAYISSNRALNEAVASPAVAAQLEEAAELRDELDSGFASTPQRKRLEKALSQDAVDARRVGQKIE